MADLKISIGADLSSAIAQVDKLIVSVDNLSETGAKASSVADMLAKIPASLKPINPAAMTALSEAVKRLKADLSATTSARGLTDALVAIPAAATKATTALVAIKPGANQAGAAMNDFSRILQDAPFGFVGISNNINPLLESFQRLRLQTGTTGGALRALGSSLTGAGGLGLAVSAITAAVTFASIGFDRWIPKIKEAKKEVLDLDTLIRSGASIQAEATASVQSQIAKVEQLARVVTDESKSYGIRENALLQLKETNKGYFGDLDLESVKTGILTEKVQEYTKALVAQAVVKGFQDDLSKVAVERAKAVVTLTDQMKAYDKASRQFDEDQKRRNSSVQSGNIGSAFQTSAAANVLGDQQKAIDETSTTVQKLNKQFDFLKTSISGAVDESLKFQTLDTSGKTKKDTDALRDQIKNLEAYRDAVGLTNTEFARLVSLREQLVRRDQSKLGLSDTQLAKEVNAIRNSNEQLEARKKVLDGIAKSVGLIQAEGVEALNLNVKIALNDQNTGALDLGQTQRTLDQVASAANLRLPLTIALTPDVQDRIRSQVGALPLVALPLVVEVPRGDLQTLVAGINTQLAASDIKLPSLNTDNFKKGLDRAFLETNALMGQIAGSIEGLISNSISGLGEALGTAIGGGGIGNAFNGLVSTLSEGLKQIGKAMIEFGTAKLILVKLGSINPGVAIAAGIGLVAAGAALQTAFASQRKFATGGIVTGPTNALVGEAGSEVIFPLNQLNRFIGNTVGGQSGTSGFIAETRLSATDIILMIRREMGRGGTSIR